MDVNLIIAGIGGQGINSLAKVIAILLQNAGYHCQFTVHKGGAQSLGSVYAEIRITENKSSILGQGIPDNKLDILIALDPWEALRHVSLSHSKTQLWIEEKASPFFRQRTKDTNIESAKSQLSKIPLKIHWRTYQKIAQQQSGSIKMANYYAGKDCVFSLQTLLDRIDPEQFDKLFTKLIRKAKI